MKKKNFHNLKPENLRWLKKIFDSKKWLIDDPESKQWQDLFDKFCDLLSLLSNEEQNLVLTLTDDFLWCPYPIYEKLLTVALRKVESEIIDNCNNIFLVPLLSPEDVERGKSKSGHMLPYVMQHSVIPSTHIFRGKQIIALTSLDKISSKHADRKDSLIIFLDDFIGSGDTACKCIRYYNNHYCFDRESVAIITLVAQKQGIDTIGKLGLNVYAAIIRTRGITDSINIPDIANAINIMKNIEDRLLIKADYLFGYGRCEALVTMIRTPNNTFPLYWCPRAKTNSVWPAPFPRFV